MGLANLSAVICLLSPLRRLSVFRQPASVSFLQNISWQQMFVNNCVNLGCCCFSVQFVVFYEEMVLLCTSGLRHGQHPGFGVVLKKQDWFKMLIFRVAEVRLS